MKFVHFIPILGDWREHGFSLWIWKFLITHSRYVDPNRKSETFVDYYPNVIWR